AAVRGPPSGLVFGLGVLLLPGCRPSPRPPRAPGPPPCLAQRAAPPAPTPIFTKRIVPPSPGQAYSPEPLSLTHLGLEAVEVSPAAEVVHIVEDGRGLPPGSLRGLGVSAGAVGFGEVDEGLSVVVAFVGTSIGGECLLVEGDGLAVAPGLVAEIGQAVEGEGFAEPVTHLAVQAKGLPAVGERQTVVAELSVEPPGRVESEGLPGLFAG